MTSGMRSTLIISRMVESIKRVTGRDKRCFETGFDVDGIWAFGGTWSSILIWYMNNCSCFNSMQQTRTRGGAVLVSTRSYLLGRRRSARSIIGQSVCDTSLFCGGRSQKTLIQHAIHGSLLMMNRPLINFLMTSQTKLFLPPHLTSSGNFHLS